MRRQSDGGRGATIIYTKPTITTRASHALNGDGGLGLKALSTRRRRKKLYSISTEVTAETKAKVTLSSVNWAIK